MSNTIDRRVVEMDFDNRKFERNVDTSIKSVDKLKQSLDFSNTSKSLSAFERNANKLDIGALGAAAETVGAKFSTMQVVAISAISNIVNKAVDAGIQLAKSLSVDQITAGFSKYDEKSTGVQTIMSATGKSIEEVNEQLDKLNWFSDETSYSFTDMVSNVGKFTSNNVDLATAVTAMQGISTWAARSGANVGEASRAMYNLSQAISLGKVTLMDWKSIQNANMATTEFKQTAIDTAVELGTLKKVGDGLYKTLEGGEVSVTNFNEALSQGWFNSDVLLKTLNRYGEFSDKLRGYTEEFDLSATQMLQAIEAYDGTDETIAQLTEEFGIAEDQAEAFSAALKELSKNEMALGQKSFRAAQEAKTWQEVIDATKDAVSTGWMNTFEQMFGNYEEAKKLWSHVVNDFYDIFAAGGEVRNEILAEWHEGGGYDAFAESLYGILQIIKDVKNAITEGLQPFKQLIGWTEELGNSGIAAKLIEITQRIRDTINSTVDGIGEVGGVLDIIRNTVSKVSESIINLKSFLTNLFGPIFARIKAAFNSFGSASDMFQSAVSSVHKFFDSIKTKGKLSERTLDSIQKIVTALMMAIKTIKNSTIALFTILKPVFTFTTKIVSYLFSKIGKLAQLFTNGTKTINDSFLSLASGKPQELAEKIQKFFDKLEEKLKNIRDFVKSTKIYQKLSEWLTDISNGIKASFKNLGESSSKGASFFEKLKEKIKSFKPLLDALKNIFKGLWNFIKPIAVSMFEMAKKLFEALKVWIIEIGDKLKNFKLGELGDLIKGGAFAAIAVNIANLSGSFAGLKDIFGKNGGLSEVFGKGGKLKELFKSCSDFIDNVMSEKMKAETLKATAIAIGILAASVFVLSTIDPDKLLAATSAVLALVGELNLAINGVAKVDKKKLGGTNTVKSLISLSAALLILAFAAKKISTIDQDRLLSSVVAIGAIMGELVLYEKFGKKVSGKGKGLVSLSISLILIASAMKKIAEVDEDSVWRAVGVVAAILGSLALFERIAGNKLQVGMAVGLIGAAAAVLILAKVVKEFAKVDYDSMKVGLITVAGLLAALAIALQLVPPDALSRAAGVLLLATSVLVLSSALSALSKIDYESLKKGLLAFGVMLAIVVASLILIPMDGALRAATIVIFASAMVLLAGALMALSSIKWENLKHGLIAIIVTMGTLIATIAILSVFQKAIFKIGAGFALFGAGIVLAATGLLILSAALTALAAASEVIVKAFIDSIIMLVTAIPNILGALATSIKNAFTSIVEMIVGVVGAIIKAVIELVPAFIEMIVTVVLGILDAITQLVPKLVETLFTIIITVLKALVAYAPEIIANIFEFLLVVLRGLTEYVPQMITEIFKLIKAIIIAINEVFADMDISDILKATAYTVALTALMTLFAGLAVVGLVVSLLLPTIAKGLSKFMTELQPFLNAITAVDPMVFVAAEYLARAILAFTAAEVINGIAGFFGMNNSLEEFGKELAAFGPYMKQFNDSVIGINPGVVMSAASAAEALVKMAALVPYRGGLTSLLIGENSLAVFGWELASFGRSFKAYAEEVADVDTSAVDASVTAATALIKMADLVPYRGGLIELLMGENSLAGFGRELKDFGKSFAVYADLVKDVDPRTVEATATAGKALAEMAQALPNDGGLLQVFIGRKDLAEFAKGLEPFATGMKEFSENAPTLTDDDIDKVEMVTKAGAMIMKMSEDIPNQGGVVTWFEGDNKLDDFAKQLPEFAEGIMGYAKKASGFTKKHLDSVEHTTYAGTLIIDMVNKLQNNGGVVSWFAGDNDISEFAKKLPDLATGIKNYRSNLGTFKASQYEAVEWSTKAATLIINCMAGIGKEGGITSLWEGNAVSMESFGKELGFFAKGIVDYTQKITEINTSGDIDKSVEIGKKLIGMADLLGKEGGIMSWFDGNKITLSGFGKDIVAFAESIAEYSKKVKGFGSGNEITDIENSITAGKAILGLADKMDKSGGLMSLFDGEKQTLTNLGEDATGFAEQMVIMADNMKDIKSSYLTNVKRSFSIANTSILPVAEKIQKVGDVSKNFNSFTESIAPFGEAIKKYALAVKGLNGSDVYNGTTLADILVRALTEHINALTDVSMKAVDAYTDAQLTALKEAIQKASDIVSSDDYTPVITPVVDMSEVEKAAKSIRSMLSNALTVTTASEITGLKGGQTPPYVLAPNAAGTTTTNNSYTQIINTPKVPSRIDIYRDTQQLLQLTH